MTRPRLSPLNGRLAQQPSCVEIALESDEVKLAELILFVKSLLNIVVRLLNEQGYELAR